VHNTDFFQKSRNKKMLLCIDIGNTNITLGLYQEAQLGPSWRLATTHERMPDEFGVQLLGLLQHQKIITEQINCAVIASVVPPLTERWVQVCQNYLDCSPLVVDSTTNTGIEILIDTPHSVGADRIVDAAAVHELYGGPACIVDFGTATTFDAISEQGNYLGGAIAPGIGISADALAQRTAKLPRVEISAPPSPIGKNTVHAMQSGLLYGYIGLVEGMVTRFRKELGNEMKTIATGGLAELVAQHTPALEIIAPWLTLDGLRLIYERNR
jgi:type III pantothenate kinase